NDVNFYLRGGLNTKNEVMDKTVQYALEEARSDYRENPYANIKEAIELLEGMLYSEIKIKPNRNLYKATLHKGKTPDQYTWLEWDKPITEATISKLERLFEGKNRENVLRFTNVNGGSGYRSKQYRGENKGFIAP